MPENVKKSFCMICGEVVADGKSICLICKERIEKESRKGKERVRKEADKELKKEGIPPEEHK